MKKGKKPMPPQKKLRRTIQVTLSDEDYIGLLVHLRGKDISPFVRGLIRRELNTERIVP